MVIELGEKSPGVDNGLACGEVGKHFQKDIK